MYSLIMLL